MQAAPPIRISIEHVGQWRTAVSVLVVGGWAVMLGWLVLRPVPVDLPLGAMLAAVALSTGWLAWRLMRVEPVDLRWDGRAWHCGPTLDSTMPGELRVAIDLGAWMLLRFVEAGSGRRRRVRWLPVQRSRLEPGWHALRCAVYSPRPGPPSVDPAGARGPSP